MAAIHVISPSEFKQNQKKFFDLALSERVVIKRGKDLFELVSKPYIDESVSPSGDPFFNDPRNLQAIREAIEQAKREPASPSGSRANCPGNGPDALRSVIVSFMKYSTSM